MASFILDVVVRDLPGVFISLFVSTVECVRVRCLLELLISFPGVGWSTAHKLQIMGVHSCQDLQKIQLTTLQKEFGPKKGQSLYRACRGHDDRPIKVEKERKSVSAEINYGIRFAQVSQCAIWRLDCSSAQDLEGTDAGILMNWSRHKDEPNGTVSLFAGCRREQVCCQSCPRGSFENESHQREWENRHFETQS